jgi:hypothetical protein
MLEKLRVLVDVAFISTVSLIYRYQIVGHAYNRVSMYVLGPLY